MEEPKKKRKRTPPKKVPRSKCTDRQLRFAAEYILDWNGTRAAQRAGYTGKDPVLAVTASGLLRNPKVSEEIERLLSPENERRNERRARVIEQLEAIAYNDSEVDVIRDKDGEILSVSRRDKIKTLELLGKTVSMFTDRIDHTGGVLVSFGEEDAGVL